MATSTLPRNSRPAASSARQASATPMSRGLPTSWVGHAYGLGVYATPPRVGPLGASTSVRSAMDRVPTSVPAPIQLTPTASPRTASRVDVRTSLPVVAVDPEARTVTDRDGKVHGYRTLIWCGDLKALYRAIDLARIADPRLARAVAARRDELEACLGSDSVLSLFLSVAEPPATFAAVSEGHLFYAPDARGLGDLHTKGLEALLAGHADGPLPERSGWPSRCGRPSRACCRRGSGPTARGACRWRS